MRALGAAEEFKKIALRSLLILLLRDWPNASPHSKLSLNVLRRTTIVRPWAGSILAVRDTTWSETFWFVGSLAT